ncbi:MAG: efflux RND transporter permease subunit [Pirellulales bacterium]
MPLRGAALPGLDRRPGGTAPPSGSARDGRLTPLRHTWQTAGWLAAAAITAAAVFGISRLRVDDDLRSLIRDDSDEFQLVDEIAAVFGPPDRDCIVRATARGGSIFDGEALAALEALADRLRGLDGVEQVRSIFDVRRQGAAGAILPVIPRREGPLDAEALIEARRRAERHPLVTGHLLSADAASSLLLVQLDPAADRQPRAAEAVAAVEGVLTTASADGGPLTLELTGLPALREQATRALRRDMLTFNGLGLSLAVVLSAAVARSLRSTLVACVPPFVGAVWALGIIGLLGAPVNILTSVVPSLALVVGTCDSIHFIEDMRRSVRRGLDPLAASSGAVHRVGLACGLTSIVTAIGFASLAVARIDAVRTFGITAAIGALASFLAVTLLTPLLASTRFCSGLRLGRSSRNAGRLAAALAAFSVRHARPLVAVACGLTLALAAIGSGLDADNRIVDSLPASAPASRALAHVDAEFGGAMGIDVVVRWPADTDWRDPAVLAAVEAVERVLGAEAGISKPISLSTVAGSLPPRARRRIDSASLSDLVAPEECMALVRARVPDLGSRRLEAIYGRVDAALADLERQRPGWGFQLAGMAVVSARNIRQLVSDLGSSLLVEVCVIACILAVAFRSPLAGVVSLIPNVFPLAVIAALLVLTGRSLDPATVIVFNVCLGLAVDDTVHVLSALARNRREGLSIATAVRRAVAETGNAVVIGGVVLTVGFAAVTASSVPSLAGFGVLACAAVAAATVAELVFLPALLVVTDRAVKRRWPVFRDGIFGASAAGSVSPGDVGWPGSVTA